MATHYIENESDRNQYYFETSTNVTSQVPRQAQDRTYTSPVTMTTMIGASEISSYPAGAPGGHLQKQQIQSEPYTYSSGDPYLLPQQHQSLAGFSKSTTQQQYPSASSPVSQVKTTVRSVNNQEQQNVTSIQHQQAPQQRQQQADVNYNQQSQSLSSQAPRQYQHYQYDSRQTVGQPSSISDYYQVPCSAQYTAHEINQRTEIPSQGHDKRIQTQQTSVRPMPSSSHQKYETSSSYQQQQQSQQSLTSQPSYPLSAQQQQEKLEDQLQQYYSQLTPEQYQQLLRQQQIQRQQLEEQKRQQLAQQQYYLQRQRIEQQQQQQQQLQPYQLTRPNQETQHHDEHQQRRIYQSSPSQEQQYRQQAHDQYPAYHSRPQQAQSTVSPKTNQNSYRQQHHHQQSQLDAYYDQQHRAAYQPPLSSTCQREQYHSTVGIDEGQLYQRISPNQQQRSGTDWERQRHDEQDNYAAQLTRQQQQEQDYAAQIEAAQSQQVLQRAQQQQQLQQCQELQQVIQAQQPSQPVGIRGLKSKFAGPTKIPTYEPKPKNTTSRPQSTSSYKSSTGPDHTTTKTHTSKMYSITYSALSKPQEPPVNSAEYYQMTQQEGIGNTSSNVQQSAVPPHIQGPAPGFDALRDRFKSGSVAEAINPMLDIHRQQQSNRSNSGLSSLRDQYMSRAKESTQSQEETFSQRIQNVSRITAVESQSQQHQKEIPNVPQIPQRDESQAQSESMDDQAISSEDAVAEGGSSSGASPLENDANLTATTAISVPSSN